MSVLASFENGIVDESTLQAKIDEVYPEWDKKDKEEYDLTYKLLNDYVDRLVPFMPSEKAEKDFYEQFDGVKVVPSVCKEEFNQLMRGHEYIRANSLKVSISKKRYNQFSREGKIVIDRVCIEKWKDKPQTTPYWSIYKKYDSELGLQKEDLPIEAEPDTFI